MSEQNYFNYFTEIEETFTRRRGKHLLLSPLDWSLMESWREREVPLHIVLRAIEQVFDVYDSQQDRKRSIKSLSYCKEEVEAQFAEWCDMQAGRSAEKSGTESSARQSGESIESHISGAISKLNALRPEISGALAETTERVLVLLQELAGSVEDAEKAEATLGRLDDMIDEALLSAADDSVVKTVEAQCAPYRENMEVDAFEKTFRLLLLKRLRDQARFPRLSLFYL